MGGLTLLGAGTYPVIGGGGSASVWDSSAKGTQIALSTTTLANDTMVNSTGGSSWSTVKGTQSRNSGLNYFEIKVLANGTNQQNLMVGLADATTGGGSGLDTFSGSFANSVGNTSSSGAGVHTGSGYAAANTLGNWGPSTNDVIQIAWDATNGFGYVGRNNTWLNGGDPTSGALGTGASFTITGTPTLFPAASSFASTDFKYQLLTTSGAFAFTPPAGYSAWSP